jgi:multicomponent Na+:H+ antiporter subunit C
MMEFPLAVVIGVLYAAGIFMLLRRTLVKLLIGLVLLSNAANLLIFTGAGLRRGRSPVIPADATALTLPVADPLPQALILTAIVIGFAVTAFALVLGYRVYKTLGMVDLDELREDDAHGDTTPEAETAETVITATRGQP